ncbi:DUF3551 domain-containing protein [Bradyrhizobium sp. LHD-71]|uniref:DUF3551 domain-containing protein n=1 Tax=Bradyrhizobium sp. LHD-71 TaxID=3072141 RepID=UPI00280E2A05|nr:DUF3551 domain-containing protein [Bradyrhizobium sp. LHD-71]MDQ8730771.1 DUF3551 domain-containing protein [Bradyrhizobium sp. LHD-71]
MRTSTMRNFILGAAALALAGVILSFAASNAAQAQEYPYCASGTWGAGGCTYATLYQCRAFISGAGGSCVRNPRYTPDTSSFARKRR